MHKVNAIQHSYKNLIKFVISFLTPHLKPAQIADFVFLKKEPTSRLFKSALALTLAAPKAPND